MCDTKTVMCMFAGCQVVQIVADRLLEHRVSCLVVDPVLVSTSGHSLGDSDVAHALVDRSKLTRDLPPISLPAHHPGAWHIFCVIASSTLSISCHFLLPA